MSRPKLGVIARADEGGLGAQTWEYCRWLKPDAILLVRLAPPRGQERTERYRKLAPKITPVRFPDHINTSAWAAFAAEVDVVLTAETTYLPDFPVMCAAQNTRLVVHANAELYDHGRQPEFTLWAPTPWLVNRLPRGTPVIPMPVDRGRCRRRTIEAVETMLHPSAQAMLDRNGSAIVKDALPHCTERFSLLVSGPEAPAAPEDVGRVRVYAQAPVENYWTAYEKADALVLPRRYGGLCLPMQEAASCGLPIVSLDVAPQNEWLDRSLCVPPLGGGSAMMKGGPVQMSKARPEQLARALDALVRGETLKAGVEASDAWAEAIDWSVWRDRYRSLLDWQGVHRGS